jgi:hypothetical protein
MGWDARVLERTEQWIGQLCIDVGDRCPARGAKTIAMAEGR